MLWESVWKKCLKDVPSWIFWNKTFLGIAEADWNFFTDSSTEQATDDEARGDVVIDADDKCEDNKVVKNKKSWGSASSLEKEKFYNKTAR